MSCFNMVSIRLAKPDAVSAWTGQLLFDHMGPSILDPDTDACRLSDYREVSDDQEGISRINWRQSQIMTIW